MASIDFESIKQKITETAGTVVDKTTSAAKSVAGKAQNAARKAKLSAEIASERDGMKKSYIELGKLYFEKYSAAPDPDLAEPVAALTEALERVAAKQAEIDALDAEPEAEEPEEADHIVDEIEQTIEAEAETAETIAEEIAEEAARAFEDTVNPVITEE